MIGTFKGLRIGKKCSNVNIRMINQEIRIPLKFLHFFEIVFIYIKIVSKSIFYPERNKRATIMITDLLTKSVRILAVFFSHLK